MSVNGEKKQQDSEDEAESNFLKVKLQTFLSSNPEASVGTGRHEHSVNRPWGDEAIEIPLKIDDTELLEALNTVRLPPRFTAIWHQDTNEFEVIFIPLTKGDLLLKRSFEFRYRGDSYSCSFGPSSSRLRAIARKARPSGQVSGTSFRNLQPFNRFEHLLEEHPEAEYVKNRIPTSFWIRGIESYDDDRVGDLVRNLNFHMSYFDRYTPTIVVHEETIESLKGDDEHQHGTGSFPETLSAKDIDQHLLILWASAEEGDVFLRFIHYYQILEYAGFYHIQDKIRHDVERAIAAPDAVSRPEKVAQQLLDAISADNRRDTEKINAMIAEYVDPREIWDTLSGSVAAFSADVELDGGFVLPALVTASASYEEFAGNWNKSFLPALHQVRNAIVHARESRQSTSIAPTIANHARLSPWLLPLSATAARVMLYSRL